MIITKANVKENPGEFVCLCNDWEKESVHRPAPVQNFSLQKKWGLQRKDFGGGYGFPGFYRVFVSTTGLESFSFGPEKFSKRFSFSGGGVRFFLLWSIKSLSIVAAASRNEQATIVQQQPWKPCYLLSAPSRAIWCDSNRESQITSDLKGSAQRFCCDLKRGPVANHNRAIWKCDLGRLLQRFVGKSCDLGSAIWNH